MALPASDEVVLAEPEEEAAPARRDRWAIVRAVALTAYFVVAVWSMGEVGVPFDRERVILWIMGALALACIGRPWRTLPRMIIDWVIFTAGVTAYDFARHAATWLDRPVYVTPQLTADKVLGFGTVPTVWMQERFFRPTVMWWDVAASMIYATHFVVPFVVAGYLWSQARDAWRWFTVRFLTVSIGSCIFFAAFPTAPPWYAARQGEMPEVMRQIGRGWSRVGFRPAATLIEKGQIYANAFAAIPSLHAAWSLLVVVAIWRRLRHPVRHLLFVYPVAMGATLVYGAEHYVVDILIGWAVVGVTLWAVPRVEARWRAWRARNGRRRRMALRPALTGSGSGAARH